MPKKNIPNLSIQILINNIEARNANHAPRDTVSIRQIKSKIVKPMNKNRNDLKLNLLVKKIAIEKGIIEAK